ncbi:MAG: pyridoxal 5'-phosphate synthase glutaminase subunit PdxT, partial [Firmicutes bacterium]|nr:pyridoxal 5'-phosphate synthase glutaminase subunit PdxT [Bacillota bacterium]
MPVGVLALQGAFVEHERALRRCGADTRQIRKAEELAGIRALVIPGGESTTMGRLLADFGLTAALIRAIAGGLPVLGTCAGLILLAREIRGSDQLRLGFLDVAVQRNGYGRQVDSFEADLDIPALGPPPFRAVFIRAPRIVEVGPEVEVLAAYDGQPVLVRQGRVWGCAFHPELTTDLRLHRYFLDLVAGTPAV